MSARRRYEVRVSRGLTAAAIEVVDVDDLEVVLFWDCTTARQARRMEEALRRDLSRLEAAEFLELWSQADPQTFA